MVDQQHDQKELVLNWLNGGAIWKDGVLLFKQFFGHEHPFIALIRKGGSQLKYDILKQTLKLYAERLPERPRNTLTAKPKLREDFPFLADLDCPVELKILASNKITAYHNYVAAHKSLFDCDTPEAQFAAVKKTVENYIENRLILQEFEHYKIEKTILGNHPIFKIFKRLQALKQFTVFDLVKIKKNLEHNIWRIRSEINKGDKKHLDVERENAITEKSMELAEVERILKDRN